MLQIGRPAEVFFYYILNAINRSPRLAFLSIIRILRIFRPAEAFSCYILNVINIGAALELQKQASNPKLCNYDKKMQESAYRIIIRL